MEGGLILVYYLMVLLTWLYSGLIIATFFVNIFDKNNIKIKTTKYLLVFSFIAIIITILLSLVLGKTISPESNIISTFLALGVVSLWVFVTKKTSFFLIFVGMLLLVVDKFFFLTALSNWSSQDSLIISNLSQTYPSIFDFFAKINNLRELLPRMHFHSWTMNYFYIAALSFLIFAVIAYFTKQSRSWILTLFFIPAIFYIVIYRDNSIINKYIKDIDTVTLSGMSSIPDNKLAVNTILFDSNAHNSFSLSLIDLKNDKIISLPMENNEEVITTALSPEGNYSIYISSTGDSYEKKYWLKYFDIQTNQVKTLTEISGYTFNLDVDWRENLIAVGLFQNDSETSVTVYNFSGKKVFVESSPTKIFFLGNKKLYLVADQKPEIIIFEDNFSNGQKTEITTLSDGSIYQDLSYKIYSQNSDMVYIALGENKYIFDLKNNSLTRDDTKNINDWVTHKGGLFSSESETNIDYTPDKKSYLVHLNSNNGYERFYLKSETSEKFYGLPFVTSYSKKFLGAVWLNDQIFIGKNFESYFVGNIQGEMASLKSTTIWGNGVQADGQPPYRNGRNWTDKN